MGGRDGHVYLGLVFFIIGKWHLYNHIKTYITHKSYRSLTWFPVSFSRYLELYFILIGCFIFICMELGRSLLDNDGAIKGNQLNHIEHACIAMTFLLHALFAILLDKTRPNRPISYFDMTHFITSIAFAQELLLFHFHSTDHVGLEGQYHWLLQEVILTCLITTLLSIWLPKSFIVGYIRSLGVLFQGVWLIVMGFMLWTPAWAPKGCSLQKDDYGHDIIKCDDGKSMHRAKALVNILFCLFLIGIMAFGVGFYMFVHKAYSASESMVEDGEEGKYELEDRQGFLSTGKELASIHLED